MGALRRLCFVSLALAPTSLAQAAQLFWSSYENCPQACSVVGQLPSNWTYYHALSDLDWCREPMLFDLGLHTPLNQPGTHITIRACTVVDFGPTQIRSPAPVLARHEGSNNNNSSQTAAGGSPAAVPARSAVHVRVTSGGPSDGDGRDVVAATDNLVRYLETEANSASTIMFAQSGTAVVGLYVGSHMDKASAAAIVQEAFAARAKADKVPSRMGAQICGDQPFRAQTFGIYADVQGNISAVQDTLRGWSTGQCLSQYDQEEVLQGQTVGILSARMDAASIDSRELHRRDTCIYVQADPGDGCWALAQKCGISEADLVDYNLVPDVFPGGWIADFCTTLTAGQYVCCEPGTHPDFSPQPNADGSCASTTVQMDNTCAVIAAANQIKDWAKLELFNEQTWGWTGCAGIQPGQVICLSGGNPPMPSAITGAVCGPQVPGTLAPTDGTKLADLNPCPLNVCCNIWGNCGLSDDFCIESPADTGAPGAAKPGSNGCISNCGMEIVYAGDKPDGFRSVGYFESFNKDRACLHMDVSKIPEVNPGNFFGTKSPGRYTHIHFAFPDLTEAFAVDVSKVQAQFDGFKALSEVKKIVSFGGWGFSNNAESYGIFRTLVSTEVNRQEGARSVIRFLTDHNLDGLDFDWEYPGASDIPGTPGGTPDEGENYLKFLTTVRNSLPAGKTLSIAAPSSFWYLKNFPIKAMSEVLDYIVYMTYDLHGQWDAGNKWTSPGCPTGNCLRHHANLTEVNLALALITKAGVVSHKVVVGMPLYGRSFKMAQAGCTGPECLFLGDRENSQAAKGACTDTAGYISNVEIRGIINSNNNPDLYGTRMILEIEDAGGPGDIIVYDDTEWVSWMKPNTYLSRTLNYWKGNFGGTSDWAIDLENDFKDGGLGDIYDDDGDDEAETPPCDYSLTFVDLDDLNNRAGGLTLFCRQVFALQVLEKLLDDVYAAYTHVDNGYDAKFVAYDRYINRITPYVIDNYMTKGLQFFDCVKQAKAGGAKKRGHCSDFTKVDRTEGSFDMELTLRDPDPFFAGLLTDGGVVKEWVNFKGLHPDHEACSLPSRTACPFTAGERDWHEWPAKNKEIAVVDPSDVVTKGMGNVEEIRSNLHATRLDINLGMWDGDIDDVVQVMSVPIFMLAEVVDGMKKVIVLADDQIEWEEEQERKKIKDIILNVIGAILFVLPFIGEIGLTMAGAASLGRMAMIAGEAANAAFDIYSMVDDPDSALLTVFGMMFGLGSIAKVGRTPKGFKDMAAKRADLSTSGGVSKIGGNFQKKDEVLQKIVKACRT